MGLALVKPGAAIAALAVPNKGRNSAGKRKSDESGMSQDRSNRGTKLCSKGSGGADGTGAGEKTGAVAQAGVAIAA